jgi:Heavy metal binding domain
MPTSRPTRRRALAALSALALAACATTTPPPRFLPVSPADVEHAESTVPPPRPFLTGDESEQRETGSAVRAQAPPHHDPGHGSEGPPSSSDAPYTCSMHPEVSAREPGKCPRCGMNLVKKAPRPEGRE